MSESPFSRLFASCRTLSPALSSATTRLRHERSVTRDDREMAFLADSRKNSHQPLSIPFSSLHAHLLQKNIAV